MHTEVMETNPAYERLLQDYSDYHLALVVVGGVFMLALLALAVVSWVRFRRAPRVFERRTHLVFALGSTGVGLLLALVCVAAGYAPDVVDRVLRLVRISEWKRHQAAPGPKVSRRAFGRERRYPISNGYRG